MRQHRIARVAVPVLAGALALTGCGSNKAEGDKGGSGGGKEVIIGMSAPLSGGLAALGLGMKNSVDLAVKKANQEGKIKGWTIKFQPEDDQADANTGGIVASRLASNKNVVAVVGTLNSSVAQQEQKTYNDANIVMISPANTNPSLTQGPDYAKGTKQRPYKSYFRVATTDAVQGPFAADYVFNTLNIKNVATINDKKTYGQGLVAEFEKKFKALGGTIVAHENITPGQKDYNAVISVVKQKSPGLVYYGGEYPEASLISTQMKSAGLKVPLMGGDGIYDGTYIKVAKANAEGDLATSVGAPTESLDTAKQFVEDYNKGGYKEPFSAYGAYAYDAAWVVIEALAKVLPDESEINDSVKQKIIDAVQGTNIDSVTGKISFDEYGDTTNKVLTVYAVKDGKWTAAKTSSFED